MSVRRILVVGSGGREHALAWRLSLDSDAPTVFVAPGNDGIDADERILGGCVLIQEDAISDLADFAVAQDIDLTVVGPEAPLCAGITDAFRARGLTILGPDAASAQLEASKVFAKNVMNHAGVRTASFETFDVLAQALEYVRRVSHPVVIKADGLAGGKGVVISHSLDLSEKTLTSYMMDGRFGQAGARVVVEEFLSGVELSFMVLTDGERAITLPTSQDHKRLGDGDSGPNTGGMGAISPSPHATRELELMVQDEVITPVLEYMRAQGHTYRGFLYAGLMITDHGAYVLEFNVRLGDPETQALMMGLRGDLGPLFERAALGALSSDDDFVSSEPTCCVVLASKGYPLSPETGYVIQGLSQVQACDEIKVFHAATRCNDEGVWSNQGGRVLGVTARARDAYMARVCAYEGVQAITWEGMTFRKDIGL